MTRRPAMTEDMTEEGALACIRDNAARVGDPTQATWIPQALAVSLSAKGAVELPVGTEGSPVAGWRLARLVNDRSDA